MRIMHVLNHLRRLNGHVHAAVDLACAQAAQGHVVSIASGGGDFEALLQRNGVQTFHVDHRRSFPNLAKSLVHLRGHVRSFRAEIVHAHMMTSAVLAFPVCRLSGIPLVTTVHNEFERSAILMGIGTRVIAVSDVVAASMRKRGVPAARLSVVLNGTIGSARMRDRDLQPASLHSPSILFVGGLHPRKGLPDLLDAFEIIHRATPNAHLCRRKRTAQARLSEQGRCPLKRAGHNICWSDERSVSLHGWRRYFRPTVPCRSGPPGAIGSARGSVRGHRN